MGARQRDWANRAKAQLIAQLGGKCAYCGSTHSLEIDHIHGRDWHPRQKEFSWRISIYRREAQAGLIQVLCQPCNGSKQ